MERLTSAGRGVACLALLLAFGSCNCEEKIREAVSRDNVKKTFGDGGGGSQPREREPNDVPEQATLVELGETLRDSGGRLSAATDRDWFSLRTDSDEKRLVNVRVVPESDQFDPAVQVELEPSSSETITYDTGGPGEKEVVRNLALSGDVRRIGIRGRAGTAGAYTIEFERRLTAGAVEREPNDVPKVATRFQFPGDIQGFYGRRDDVDWYHVLRQDAKPGIYRLNIKPTGSFPQTVELYVRRGAEEPYLSAQVAPSSPLDIPNVRIPTKLDGLWIRFSAGRKFGRDAGYRLRMVEHPSEERRTVEAEPNGRKETSMGVEIGEVVGGYLHAPSDVDRFHLAVGRPLPEQMADTGTQPGERDTAGAESRDTGSDEERARDAGGYVPPIERVPAKDPPEHVVQVGLEPISKKDRLTLVWFRGGPRGDARTYTAAKAGDPVRLCNHPMDRGLMHLGVRAAELQEKAIRRGFTYEFAAIDIAPKMRGLEIEPNDRRQRADRLEIGEERTGFISRRDDTDLYAFGISRPEAAREGLSIRGGPSKRRRRAGGANDAGEAEEKGPSGVRSVRVKLRGNELNLGFDVLDSQGALVAEIDRNGPGADESTSIDLPPGLYYVRVAAGGDSACKPYRIGVQTGKKGR